MSDLRSRRGAEETNDQPDETNELPTPPVRISVLGPLQIDARGKRVPVKAQQQRRLIALLAAAATEGRPVSADHIADALYEGRGGDKARSATATAVWRLRQVLGADALEADASGYALDLARCSLDAVDFETLVDAGQRLLHGGATIEAAESLRNALDQWRGEPLPDIADHADGRAVSSRLTELRLGATEDLAEALAATGRAPEAITALEPLTLAHPAREHAWALLIECYLLDGQHRRARQAYDTAVRHLAEHGLEPGAELAATRSRFDESTPEPLGTATAPTPATPRDRPPVHGGLFGRDRELTIVLDAIRSAISQRTTRLVVVSGEAGIGKTALLDAANAALAGGGTTIARAAGDVRIELPYASLQTVLDGLDPVGEPASTRVSQLSSAMNGASDIDTVVVDKAGIADAIAERLEEAAADNPAGVVVTLDDAHWATVATLEALLHVVARRRSVPLVLVAAIRQPAKLGEGVAELLSELRRRATLAIELRGLDEDAVGAMLGGAATDRDTAAWAHGVSGGNPLYVTQLATLDLAALRGDHHVRLPVTLDEAIAARLAMLPEAAITVLQVAAVAGPSFDGRVVMAAATKILPVTANQVVDALRMSVAAGVVLAETGGTATYRFVHTLTSKHLYFGLAADERCQAHVAVGEALERLSTASAPPVALLAHHFGHGWPACSAEMAARYLRSAGDRSAAQLDFGLAGEFYGRALDIVAMDAADDGTRLERDLLALAAETAVFNDDLPRSRAAFAQLGSAAERAGDLEGRLRAAAGMVDTYSTEAVDAGALDGLQAVLEDVLGDPKSVDAKLLATSVGALYRSRPGVAGDIASEAMNAPGLAATILPTLWEQQSVEDQLVTADLLNAHPEVDPHRAWLRRWIGDIAAGKGSFAHPPPRPLGEPAADSDARRELTLGRILVAEATGDLDRAERLIRAAWDALHRPDNSDATQRYSVNLLGQLSVLALLRGDPDAFANYQRTVGRTWSTYHPITRAVRAYGTALRGDVAAAHEACDALVDELVDGEMPAGNFLARTMMLGHACIWSGHTRGIAACRAALAPSSGQHVFFYITIYFGAVNGILGRLAAAMGDTEAAIAHMEMALQDYGSIGSPINVPSAQGFLDGLRASR